MSTRNLTVLEPSVLKWATTIPLNICQMFLTILIVIGNGLLLSFIFKHRQTLLKSNIFILSLTLSDFLTGLLVTPFAHYVSRYDVSQLFCDAHQMLGQFFARISSTTIMIISIDRFVKLSYPITYNNTDWRSMRGRRTIAVTIWLSSGLISMVKFIDSITNSGNYVKGCFYRSSYSVMDRYELLFTVMGSNIVAVLTYIGIVSLVFKCQNVPYVTCQRSGSQSSSSKGHVDTVVAVGSLRKHVSTDGAAGYSNDFGKHYAILGSIIILNFIFVSVPPLLFSLYMICQT